MTQRSIHAGKTPAVIVKAGMNVQVDGWDDDDERVLVSTEHKWGGLEGRTKERITSRSRPRPR